MPLYGYNVARLLLFVQSVVAMSASPTPPSAPQPFARLLKTDEEHANAASQPAGAQSVAVETKAAPAPAEAPSAAEMLKAAETPKAAEAPAPAPAEAPKAVDAPAPVDAAKPAQTAQAEKPAQVEKPAAPEKTAAPVKKGKKPASRRPSWTVFWSLGFRPFYLLGSVWAAISVALWVYAPQYLGGVLTGLYWHIHEMLWGLMAMFSAGFLLTSAASWTRRAPVRGSLLVLLCGLWITARVAFLLPGVWPLQLALGCELLFFLGVAAALARVILSSVTHRNYMIPFFFLAFAASDAVFLQAVMEGAAYEVVIGFFNVGLLVMTLVALLIGGRALPFFAGRALPEKRIPMCRPSGLLQLWLCAAVLLVMTLVLVLPDSEEWLLPMVVPTLYAISLITLYRWLRWQPWAARRKPILWILYLGYLGFGVGLAMFAGWQQDRILRSAWPAHVIGIGGMGLLTMGMMTRTSLGHLGRPLVADGSMVLSYWLMLGALLLRLGALWLPFDWSPVVWLNASAACWIAAFALFCWRFFPWLIRPRL